MDTMKQLGWTPSAVSNSARKLEEENAELKAIGNSLGWRKTPPTFKWLSEKVGHADEYNYIYHATSSFVHFSPHELHRRVWGRHGHVIIGSSSFTDYWEDFAAYWSTNTFIQTVVEVGDVLSFDDKENDFVLDIIKALYPVPIITTAEVQAWSEPRT